MGSGSPASIVSVSSAAAPPAVSQPHQELQLDQHLAGPPEPFGPVATVQLL